MTALAKTVSLLLILIAATGSPAWCCPAVHAPLQDPLDQPSRLTNASGEGGLRVFLDSRSTPFEMTWLVRRIPQIGVQASQMSTPSAMDAFVGALTEVSESAVGGVATTSLIALHSQLTV